MPNFDPDSECLCGDCILKPPAFSGARSFGYYTGELGGLVRAFKFQNRRNLVELLGPFLVDTFHETWNRDDFDMILAVPLHPKRLRDRGYNQAGLLARSLSLRIRVPFNKGMLIRKRPTLPQTGLSDSRRAANVRNAFACENPERISGRRILLVDDVMTTGATVSSASRALVRSGALRVSVLTLARTIDA
jgi:ComF family protein